MRTDPRIACANERQRLLWALIHDGLAHPLMALTGYCKAAVAFHDYTSHKAWPRTPKRRKGLLHRTLTPEYAEMIGDELRSQGRPFCITAEPHHHEDGKRFYIYEVEEL